VGGERGREGERKREREREKERGRGMIEPFFLRALRSVAAFAKYCTSKAQGNPPLSRKLACQQLEKLLRVDERERKRERERENLTARSIPLHCWCWMLSLLTNLLATFEEQPLSIFNTHV
jgi:hypothetical protein